MLITADAARELVAKAGASDNFESLEVAVALTVAIIKAATDRQSSCTFEFAAPVEHSGNRTHLLGSRMIDEYDQFVDYTHTAKRICDDLTRSQFEAELKDRSLIVKW